MMYEKLTKSSDKMLAGVCGGIADFLEVDPTLVRVVYSALTVFFWGIPGMILYIILWIVIPENDDEYKDPF